MVGLSKLLPAHRDTLADVRFVEARLQLAQPDGGELFGGGGMARLCSRSRELHSAVASADRAELHQTSHATRARTP